jgi:hypothetical protein
MVKAYFAYLCLVLALGCSEPRPSTKDHPSAPPPHPGQICVSVSGQVHQPGKYFLPEGSKLRDAVQEAGGFTDFAILRRITIHHPNFVQEDCNFRVTGGDIILSDGDRIVVHSNGMQY